MSTIHVSSHYAAAGAIEHAVRAFAAELNQFVRALVSPKTIINEVLQMHAMQLTQPTRARRLRRQAARIGLC